MDRLIYSYALIKSLYDEEQDYLDTFIPFILKVFKENEFVNKKNIQNRIKKEFDLDIMQHVIAAILNRDKEKRYVKKKKNKYSLTENGSRYVNLMETDKEIGRKINSLVEDIKKYFEEHDASLDSEQIYNFLLAFINNNLEYLVESINPAADFKKISFPEAKENEKVFIEYITLAEKQKPQQFEILQQMIMGSIISAILYAKDPSEFQTLKSKQLKNLDVYLDTNFVLFVLGLFTPEFNGPAQELFDLLKEHHLNLKIFDFTVEEVSRVIINYEKEAHRYPATVKVDTLYSSLKRKGWKKTDVREFVINIEETLHSLGINIEPTNIDLDNYEPPDKKLREDIELYKPGQPRPHQNHDLAAIEKIKELRGKKVRKIEYSRACFLTSDHRLSEFNFREMNHKENLTICEVILDRLLANIIWLKNPKLQIPLKLIISSYSRELFVKKSVWNRFYYVLSQVKQDGKATDDQISNLFYQGYIEKVLLGYDEADVTDISEEFVLEKIEDAAKRKEEITKNKLREAEERKNKEFTSLLIQKTNEARQEEEQKWLEKIQRIKNEKLGEADRKAGCRIIIIKFLVAIVIGTPLLYCLVIKNYELYTIVVGILTLFALIIVLVFDPINIKWKKLRDKYTNKIYLKEIQKAGLKEFE